MCRFEGRKAVVIKEHRFIGKIISIERILVGKKARK
jgi:hypothetical protein